MTQGLILTKQNKGVSFKTLSRKRFIELESRPNKLGEQTLSERIAHNLTLTNKIIEGCAQNGIGHYRLSLHYFPCLWTYLLSLTLPRLKGRIKF